MPGITLGAKLDRADPSIPWGFRMQGGKDFSSPLTIQRVTPGSLADKCGVLPGDVILQIGATHTDTLKHKEAQDTIIKSGNSLDFLIQRGRGGVSAPAAPAPDVPKLNSENSGLYSNQNYNRAAKPFGASASLANQTQGLTISEPPRNQGIADPGHMRNPPWQRQPIVQSGDDTKKYVPSETYKLIQEEEAKRASESKDEPIHSKTFKVLQKQMDGDPDAVRGPPKPSQFTGPLKVAPSATGFQPKPAPQGPTPFKLPTGVGGVKGRIGDQIIYKNAKEAGLGMKIPVCASCGAPIRGTGGPFVLALGKSWCPDHFVCANPQCGKKLLDVGFVEENGQLYCEEDYAKYFAPSCSKCKRPIVGEVVNAVGSNWHPNCFVCFECNRALGGGSFHIEEGNYYCDADWRAMFQTKCVSCEFPVEPGDKWVQALGSNWHAECFNCVTCQVNLEGIGYIARNGKPYCKKHGAGGFM